MVCGEFTQKYFLRPHSSNIKPYLIDANEKARLHFCGDTMERGLLADSRFKVLFDFVFLDEK